MDNEKVKLLKVHQTGSKEVKKALESEFGKDYFIVDIKDRVKSFEDALSILEQTRPSIGLEYKHICDLKSDYAKRLIAEFQLLVLAEVLNEGWKPNWNDSNEYKYYPWFYFVGGAAYDGSSAGLGCAYSTYAASDALTAIGSRLCFKTRAMAEHVGNTFMDIYSEFLLG